LFRFLFYTDLHLHAKQPRHRADVYVESVLTKLEEVYDIARREAVDFVTFGGDFYHSWRIFAYEVINAAMDIVCGAGVPTFAIVGQHDIYGYNQSTYVKSTLCFQERHCQGLQVVTEPLDLGEVVLYPVHGWDDFDQAFRFNVTRKKKTVLLIHKLLCDTDQPFDIFQTSDYDWPYNLVLAGDLHSGFPIHKVGRTILANPGSIGRPNRKDMQRMPKVLIVEGQPRKELDIREVFLQNAKPYEEIFKAGILDDIGAASAAAFGLASSTAAAGDEFAKQSRALGFNVEAYQELQDAAERSGVSAETFNSSMTAFTKRLGEAAEGSGPAKDALEQLGLSAEELVGLEPDVALAKVADAMRGVDDPARKAALAADLLADQASA